jgi:shikimate kinase
VELVADTGEIARREGLNAPRSVALGAPRAMLARMARELREVYREFADVSVDTGGVAPEEVRDRVLAAL